MARRFDTHVRVSSDAKEVLKELKSDIYEDPDEVGYGDVIAYLAGYYTGN